MTQKKMKIEKKVALLKKLFDFSCKKNLCFFSSDLFVFKYVNNFFSEMSQRGIKIRSKIRKIANYLTFYDIL